ncbi:uncharacterized protein FPOAC1_013977 [Fusarium poae]|uniref:uncharacterized protein n=1 Tax=Fusarium poae TaxID=36050 RepID=UPI001D058D8B|nr:uncharacterized protein FPOAC1_013977 [Fusarium poae]KAG8664270.1 hypothetical protein FPOAC1_013977 [Fusarium poae]
MTLTFNHQAAGVTQSAIPHNAAKSPDDNVVTMTNNGIGETFARVPAVDIDDIPGQLPTAQIPDGTNLDTVVKHTIDRLNNGELPDLLAVESLWRDIFALTGTLRTFHSSTTISAAWRDLQTVHKPGKFAIVEASTRVKQIDGQHSWIHARISFETQGDLRLRCTGSIGLIPEGIGWKIWLLTTVLEEIVGLGSPDKLSVDTTNTSHSTAETSDLRDEYDCVVVGAGFGGLCVAGRLKAIGVDYLVVDKQERIGDNWLDRYDSARFHTSKWYSDLPIERVFDESNNYYLTAQELADGYQKYVDRLSINVALSTSLEKATYRTEQSDWILRLSQAGQMRTVVTKHVVLAIGAGSGQIPKMPELPGRDKFRGTVLHSKFYKNCNGWKGLRGVVIGAANTAHDVAEDMVAAGLQSVTMLGMSAQAASQPERFEALERAGFKLDRSFDLWQCMTKRNGGHYMDVGGSAKIASGLIKMKSDGLLEEFTESGLAFSNGSHLPADVVVFCTGFANEYRNEAVKFVGPESAPMMDDYWYLDSEGELRGAFKKQGLPGIWYTGGGVQHARFYSRFIVLQIKADLMGKSLPVYKARKYTKEPSGQVGKTSSNVETAS